ncbi:MAG: 50S ribosomal protein L30 [Candidatus Aenigmarchaeota archaeon]|nr:50S ribosomal protein L30 [Candidatus Aenigmarchaeota archaeon]
MLAVVRIKGIVGMSHHVKDTLKMLRLDTTNSCSIIPETKIYRGMIQVIKDHVTFGEVDKETVTKLLEKRLRMTSNNKRVDEKSLKSLTGFNSYSELADMLLQGTVKLNSFKGIQPNFRLTPPSKGFKSVNEHYPRGDIGNRGKEIKTLIESMI